MEYYSGIQNKFWNTIQQDAAGWCEFWDQKQGDLKSLNFAMKYDGDD
jgi:hypothetical protein